MTALIFVDVDFVITNELIIFHFKCDIYGRVDISKSIFKGGSNE